MTQLDIEITKIYLENLRKITPHLEGNLIAEGRLLGIIEIMEDYINKNEIEELNVA